MSVRFEMTVVPPDGGEVNFALDTTADTLPKKGEYINLKDEESNVSLYLVNEVVHYGAYKEGVGNSNITGIGVYVEPVEHQLASESHKSLVAAYKTRGYEVKTFPDTGY